ncbi:DUF805 domain-containing protein [Pseudomonas purpurea]|uniref:DUF805 domain-containing protein n=1 Tax=Pseudomonas purpurea TaxID=3136737 RepID=UPI003263A081
MTCWIRLGIEPTKDHDIIRSAYRSRLPEHHPETDPQGFQALRAAYDAALRFARQEDIEDEAPADDEPTAARQTLVGFEALLSDPTRRFNSDAWLAFMGELDQLPLEAMEEVSWGLLYELISAGPISNHCARLLAQRLGWSGRLLDVEFDSARQIDEFLQRIEEPDPFDTALMTHWSAQAQLETLWYTRTLDYLYQHHSLDEFKRFASLYTCLPLPAGDSLSRRWAEQFSQAGIGSKGLLELCTEQHRLAPQDLDWLYLLACQRGLLGLEELALQCWVKLWREHRYPKAAAWLLKLCAERQPKRLPLLIQAFDRLENFRDWSHDLAHVSQAYGSPSQRPETLGRWFHARQLDLSGIAEAFVLWRIGGDELPLLAWLIGEHADPYLCRLYRHAWALHRGDVALLQQVMNEPDSDDVLDALLLEGFKYQAEQQICWLTQAPIPLALKSFVDSHSAQPVLAPELQKGEPCDIALLWLRRLRPYDQSALARLDQAFSLGKHDEFHRGVCLMAQLAEQGVVLPAIGEGEAVWEWHRQTVFLQSLLDDPRRWLTPANVQSLEQMNVDRDHPLARLQPLLRRLGREQGGLSSLLGWLQDADPVHALLARRFLGVQQALDSAKLLGNDRLYACMCSEPDVFDDDALGLMLLCGVLYRDPLLDTEQHRYLLSKIARITSPVDWFESFRDGLLKGEPPRPPRQSLEEGDSTDSSTFYLALDALKGLVRYGGFGVPRSKALQQMQREKDNPAHGPGLRLALSALLSWSERLLLAKADSEPVSPRAFWKLGSRLGRKAFFGQALACLVLTPLIALLSGSSVMGIAVLVLGLGILLGAVLRRLHDLGRGLPMMVVGACLTPVLPFLPGVLFFLPGEKLPNCYGVPPDSGTTNTLSGGLQATLRRLNG